jgi:hypothetical protein
MCLSNGSAFNRGGFVTAPRRYEKAKKRKAVRAERRLGEACFPAKVRGNFLRSDAMLGRLAAIASIAVLASCAGMESASRDTRDVGVASPAPAAAAPAPTAARDLPAPSTSAPVAAAPPPPQASVAPAPVAAAPAPAPAATPAQESRPIVTQRSPDEVVVPGVRERQVQPPRGDPRSVSERMEDIRAWDQCVTRVQAAYESDPMNPQLDSPEEYCRQSLGMSDREAIPLSRSERRRN